jgi:hypothetical protein
MIFLLASGEKYPLQITQAMSDQLKIISSEGVAASAEASPAPRKLKAGRKLKTGGSSHPISANSGGLSLQLPNPPIARKSLAERVNSDLP